MSREVSFSVQGEFITSLAREKYKENHNLTYAIDLLTGCLQSDDIELSKQLFYALLILNNKAHIEGTYPNDDYGLVFDDKNAENNTFKSEFISVIKPLQETIQQLTNKSENLIQKYNFLLEYLDLPEYKQQELDEEYYARYEEHLFHLEPNAIANTLLTSFIERQHNQIEDEEDYGWLEPDGTFHPIPWGEHEIWAGNHIKKHFQKEYEVEEKNRKEPLSWGDFLINRNWILLHSPAQGIAKPTKQPTRQYTKRQKEFLYDYYMKRNQHELANKIYKD